LATSRLTLTGRTLVRCAVALATAGSMTALAGLGPAVATTVGETWSQAQGGPAKTGVAASGPSAPYAIAWSAEGKLGGPDGRYGFSPPALTSQDAVVVGPTRVVGYRIADGSQAFAVDRDYGPSVPPAIAEVPAGEAAVYTEGFGDNPPTASGTPRATPSSAPASPSGSGSPASPVDSHLAAFDLATQEPLWAPIQLGEVSRTGVTVDGTTAYLGDIAGTVYAVDLVNGKVEWKVRVGGTLVASVAAAGDRVVVCSQGSRTQRSAILGLSSRDGSTVWRDEASVGAILSSPSVGGGAVYVGSNDATVRAYDLEQGTQRWSARLSAPTSVTAGPAVTEDAVYALDLFGELYRLDPATGARSWEYALNEGVYRSAPVVVGETALVATARGRLAGIDTATGHLIYDSGAPGAPLRGLAVAPDAVIGVRGGVHAGLVAFQHDEAGRLLDLVSPTVVDPGRLGVNFAIAAVVFVALMLVAGRLIAPRMGPAFLYEDGPVGDPEDTDGDEG
jgi:outer membrane protein assembly factor BamB